MTYNPEVQRRYRSKPEVRERYRVRELERSRKRREDPAYRAYLRDLQREWSQTKVGRESQHRRHERYRAKPEKLEAERAYGCEYQRQRREDPMYRAQQVQYQTERGRRLYKTDPAFRFKRNLRRRLILALKGGARKGSAVRLLGCTVEQAMVHLESLFQPVMTWENWGFKGWHVDHIKPLAAFDLQDEEQLRHACHYTNLRPLWWRENLSKGAKEV